MAPLELAVVGAPVPPAPEQGVPAPVQESPEVASTESEQVLPETESAEVLPVTESDTGSAAVDQEELLDAELERQITSTPAPVVQSTPEAEATRDPLAETQEELLTTSESESTSPVAGIERETPPVEPVIFEAEEARDENFPWQIALAVATLIAAGALALRFSGI